MLALRSFVPTTKGENRDSSLWNPHREMKRPRRGHYLFFLGVTLKFFQRTVFMTILTILICLALQKFADVGGWFSSSWFEAYLKLLLPWLKKIGDWLGIVLVILPVCLILALLHYLLIWKMIGFGLFDLLLVVIVLFFTMDARDFKHGLVQYFECNEKNNLNGAATAVAEFLSETTPVTTFAELNRAVTKAIALRSFEKIFAVLFWFTFFGIYGAAIYYTVTLLKKSALQTDVNLASLAQRAAKVQSVLDWLPARVLGFSYVIVGKFTRVFNYWVKSLGSTPKSNQDAIITTSLAAVDVDPAEQTISANPKENYDALDLINRVLIIWVVAVALFSLGTLV